MELRQFKPLIILGVVFGILIIVLLFLNNSNSTSTNPDSENQNKKVKIDYPEVKDNEEDILAKIYNPNYDYYSGFINKSEIKENIFNNEKEAFARNFDQTTRMSYALYSFNLSDMSKVSCSTISWNSSWNSSCGSNGSNMAYVLPVSELNNRVEEIFNIRPDYSELNINDLEIGLCSGHNNRQYKFRYIKDRSVFVSEKRNSSCYNNGKIEVTSVEKEQHNDFVHLEVYYKKIPTINLNGRVYYGTSTDYHDRFHFKVKKDGTYYFTSSTLIKGLE